MKVSTRINFNIEKFTSLESLTIFVSEEIFDFKQTFTWLGDWLVYLGGHCQDWPLEGEAETLVL